MNKHRHKFSDEGIYLKYCDNLIRGKMCVFAKDIETGKVGKFVIISGQGRLPD